MIDLSYMIPDMKTNTNNKTEERKNRFNGESVMLTKDEAFIHDQIFKNELPESDFFNTEETYNPSKEPAIPFEKNQPRPTSNDSFP